MFYFFLIFANTSKLFSSSKKQIVKFWLKDMTACLRNLLIALEVFSFPRSTGMFLILEVLYLSMSFVTLSLLHHFPSVKTKMSTQIPKAWKKVIKETRQKGNSISTKSETFYTNHGSCWELSNLLSLEMFLFLKISQECSSFHNFVIHLQSRVQILQVVWYESNILLTG